MRRHLRKLSQVWLGLTPGCHRDYRTSILQRIFLPGTKQEHNITLGPAPTLILSDGLLCVGIALEAYPPFATGTISVFADPALIAFSRFVF